MDSLLSRMRLLTCWMSDEKSDCWEWRTRSSNLVCRGTGVASASRGWVGLSWGGIARRMGILPYL